MKCHLIADIQSYFLFKIVVKSKNIYESIQWIEILLVYTSEPDLIKVSFDEKVIRKFDA